MANYYDKNHILKSPELEPKRHYESSGTFSTQGGDNNNKNQQDNEDFSDHPLYSILDKLYKMRAMGKLLPDPESKIFENVNESLIRFTQGLVIDSFENPVTPEYSKPKTNDERYYSTNVEENESDVDIFGENINYDIEIEDQESLYSLAYNAFVRDYNDVAREYTSSMEQVIHRFFQSMLTIADDAEMPDYTYLMESFDGNAVKVNDKDLLHARDYIVKLQRIRESDTRLMQKEFTAENTLIRGRGWLSAEKQRERYLKANYKVNTSSLCATMGNNALFESRASAEEQYNQAMTNMYKYLNSSAITMGDALDKRVNEGALKGELALNGIDIYEKTPEPLPADTSGLDMKSTSDVEDALGKAIDDNAKDFQVNDSGGGSAASGGGKNYMDYTGSVSGGSGLDVNAPHPNIEGTGVERWEPYVVDAIKANGLEPTPERVHRILAQIATESSGDPGVDQQIQDVNSGGNEARGLMQIIPTTFAAHSFAGHTDPYNGYDSLLASVHYIKGRYGDDFNGIGAGHGY